MLKKLKIVAQKALFPSFCVICKINTPAFPLCKACLRALPTLQDACPRCSHPLPYHGICGQCLKRPPAFDSSIACFEYGTPIKELLYRFKMNAELSLAPIFASLMAHRIKKACGENPASFTLLPMPLHPRRIRYRGFNPTLEIARHLRHRLNMPMNRQLAYRHLHRSAQSGLAFKDRKKNVKGVFKTHHHITQPVAILDDVMTTGATVESLAKTLKKAGAPSVTVWCLAKTTLDGLFN